MSCYSFDNFWDALKAGIEYGQENYKIDENNNIEIITKPEIFEGKSQSFINGWNEGLITATFKIRDKKR